MDKLKKFLPVIVTLFLGTAIGWFAGNRGQREVIEEEDSPPITKKAVEKMVRDSIRAPEDGFNPDFVKVTRITLTDIPDAVLISGKLATDAERVHLVSSRVAGRLDRILFFEGVKVARGQAIAELFSPDWISVQNEYLLARNAVRALRATSQKDLIEEAKFTEQSVISRMKVLGALDGDIAHLDKTGKVSTHLRLRAPIAGTIVRRAMDPGAFLNVGDDFMTIADTSKVWFIGNFYEKDYAKVKLGQTLRLRVPALPEKDFQGTVNYIGTTVDPDTHVLPVRCTVDNPGGELRPELFATAQLITGVQKAIVVPKSAIISIREDSFVIIEAETNLFRRIPVTTKTLGDGRIAVTSGLSDGERVVTEGATLVNEAIIRG
ncbi:MAG: efflux RND transporter periplasmic adaptor subunit [Candidatus Accumulibacter sp.]|jgi:Cu(I)/Ag(I) efflux system membrane fusion protein|nr:efflux RND transporter periplasmic adaptor subunit [Accumulibacter sp.]